MMSKGKYSMQLIPHFLPRFHLPYLQFHAHSVLLKREEIVNSHTLGLFA